MLLHTFFIFLAQFSLKTGGNTVFAKKTNRTTIYLQEFFFLIRLYDLIFL